MSSLQGIYVIDGVHEQNIGGGQQALGIDSSMTSNSNVDGVSLTQKVTWADLEPSDGVFVWSSLDSLIAQAAGAGKRVTIGILPGWKTPAWVYADGAQAFNFVWDQTIWGPGICNVASIPVPWDAVYLAKWSSFIHAMGARYNGNYTVAAVKIEGINSEDEETNLPAKANRQITDGQTSCTGYDYPLMWQSIGYRRTLIVNTWQRIAQVYARAFPNKLLTAVMQPGGFPPIDQNGAIFNGINGMDQFAPMDIMADGVADFGVQFSMQNDALSAIWIWTVIEGYAPQYVTGYQTSAALGADLTTAMTLATNGGANYLELYEGDLTNPDLQSEIAAARQLLQNN